MKVKKGKERKVRRKRRGRRKDEKRVYKKATVSTCSSVDTVVVPSLVIVVRYVKVVVQVFVTNSFGLSCGSIMTTASDNVSVGCGIKFSHRSAGVGPATITSTPFDMTRVARLNLRPSSSFPSYSPVVTIPR